MNLPRYLVRRLFACLATFVGVSILIFGIARVIPGDPARIALGPTATDEQVREFRIQLGLDQPLPQQYAHYVSGLLHGDLGVSLYTNAPVARDLRAGFPAAFELVLVATLFMVGIGIPLGVIAARHRDGAADNVIRLGALLGVVTPSFVWAVLLMLVFSDYLGWLPIDGRLSETVSPPPSVTGLYLVELAAGWSAACLPECTGAYHSAGNGALAGKHRPDDAADPRQCRRGLCQPLHRNGARLWHFRATHRLSLCAAAGIDPDLDHTWPGYCCKAWQRIPGGNSVRLARHGAVTVCRQFCTRT